MRFWDSSAILPLALDEPSARVVRSLLRRDAEAILWWGTPVECASALERTVREGRLARAAAESAWAVVVSLRERAFEVQPSEEVRLRSLRLLKLHPIRAADAFQLAAALTWCREQTAGSGFVCLDERLRQAALLEGFEVLP